MPNIFWYRIPPEMLGLGSEFKDTVILIVNTIEGLMRIFAPGRRSRPRQVGEFNNGMVAAAIWSLMDNGWEFDPLKLFGVPIHTEGNRFNVHESLAHVYPTSDIGGEISFWARRSQINGDDPERIQSEFEAVLFGYDDTLIRHPVSGATGTFFDIIASGATFCDAVLPTAAPMFERLIFASPCMSIEGAKRALETAVELGKAPENLAVVANAAFFGMHTDKTILSLQLEGTLTSLGCLALSKLIYEMLHCHIGSGGRSATKYWQVLAEILKDESLYGIILQFFSLQAAMEKAKVKWPNDFTKLAPALA